MNAIQGIVRNGQIILDNQAHLAEGTRVSVLPFGESSPAYNAREDDWPTTSEGIAALLARMDQVEPGWLSEKDDVSWRTALSAMKEIEKAEFMKNADSLQGGWQ